MVDLKRARHRILKSKIINHKSGIMRGTWMKRTRRNARGFTLIELLVVILIISMLAGFVAPNVLKRLGKAKTDLARPRMALIENALKSFEFDCGRLPDEAEGGLEALIMAPPALEEKWS